MASSGGSAASDTTVKLLLLGNQGVGKSSLLRRFVDGTFQPSEQSTIGVEFRSRVLTIEDPARAPAKATEELKHPLRVKCNVFDAAGQERYRSVAKSYYQRVHGILLCFAVAGDRARESFEDVRRWIAQLRSHAAVDIRFILLATKLDLVSGEQGDATGVQWAVSEQEARALAEEFGCELHLTSSRDGRGVEAAFASIAGKAVSTVRQKAGDDAGITLGAQPGAQSSGCCAVVEPAPRGSRGALGQRADAVSRALVFETGPPPGVLFRGGLRAFGSARPPSVLLH